MPLEITINHHFISEFVKTTSGVATIIDEDIIYPGMPRKF